MFQAVSLSPSSPGVTQKKREVAKMEAGSLMGVQPGQGRRVGVCENGSRAVH